MQRQKEMKARDDWYERERKRIESEKAIKIQEAHANMLNKLRKSDNSLLGRIQDILRNLIKSKHEVRTFELLTKLVDEIIERLKTFQKLLNEAKQERY